MRDLERKVLAEMMWDDKACAYSCSKLTEVMFEIGECRAVFNAIKHLYTHGTLIDSITIVRQLERTKQLNDTFNEQYVVNIQNESFSAAGNEYTCDMIIEEYQRRIISDMSTLLVSASKDKSEKPSDIINSFIVKLENLIGEEYKREFVHVNDLLFPVMNKIIERSNAQKMGGIPSGIPRLDKYTNGWQSGEVIIIGAQKKAGKSILGMLFALEASRTGHPTGIFSYEMSRESLVERIISNKAQVDTQSVHWNKLKDEDIKRMSIACSDITNLSPIILDDNPGVTIDNLIIKAKRMKTLYDIKLLVIDYLQLMPSAGNEGRQREVEKISHGLKGLAKRLQIPIIIISQLGRAPKGLEHKVPHMNDLRDSGSLEADASIVLLIYNPGNERKNELLNGITPESLDNVRELIIAANRFGKTGSIPLYFKGEYSQIGELE